MINIIVCMDNNNAIGYNNKLLAHLPKDMKYFKETTSGHTVVMGRKTHESIGKKLTNRKNIVLTREIEPVFVKEGCSPYNSLESVIELSKIEQIFVIGGSEIYNQLLPLADRLYITRINYEFKKADSFFPKVNFYEWALAHIKREEDNGYELYFETYNRVKG